MHPGTLLTCGRLDYGTAWGLQRRLHEARASGRCTDTLVLLEHPPLFTIGRTGRAAHWGGDEQALRNAGYPVYHVERGGSITYHGPGQVVGYPILRLNLFCPGPKTYMRMLEEVLIRTLADWGIVGDRIEKLTGVWVGREKIASMGVRLDRGITMHGFALNASVDLTPFSWIVPCGIADCRITSMEALLGRPVDCSRVRNNVAERFAEVFSLEWGHPVSLDQSQIMAESILSGEDA